MIYMYVIEQVRLQLQGVSYIVWKVRELWSTNGLKLDRHFYSPSVNSAFYFIAMQALQTEIGKQNWTKLRQTTNSK